MLEINNTTKQRINLKKTQEIATKFLRAYKKTGQEVSLAIVADAKMKSLNFHYRGIAKATDVLSFPGEKSAKFLGEIVIDIQEARRAGKYREMFKELDLDLRRLPADYIFYFRAGDKNYFLGISYCWSSQRHDRGWNCASHFRNILFDSWRNSFCASFGDRVRDLFV